MYFAPNSLLEKTPVADAVTKPDPSDSLPSPLDQSIKLSPADIEKVLYLTGISDAGRFDAIIANIDTAGLLAMFGMSYAELKEILAIPDDRLATAPEKDAQLVTDKGISAAPENLSPYPPLPKMTFFTGFENDPPMSSDTELPAEPPTAASPPPAPPTLDDGHAADLPPQPVDSNAISDAAITPPPATSDTANPVTPEPLTPAPVDSGIHTSGGDEQTDNPVAASNGNVDTDAGAGNAHHDDDTESHADAGIGADAGNADHDNKPNPDASAGAGTDAQHNGADDSIVANDGSVPANDAAHTPTGAKTDAQNSDGDLHDGTEQNQNDDVPPLVSSELLLADPPGSGSTPPAEPPVVPPVLPPVAQPVVQPVGPVTDPVAPVTEPVLPPSVPVTPVPQQPSAVSDRLPGSNQGDSHQNGVPNTETAGGIKPVAKPSGVNSGPGGSSSSSSGWNGFDFNSGGGGGSGIPVPGVDSGSMVSNIVAGGAGSLVVRSIFNDGASQYSFDSGSHDQPVDHETPPNSNTGTPPVQPPMQGPDLYAAWQTAYASYNQAATQINRLQRELVEVTSREAMSLTQSDRAEARLAGMAAQVSRAVTQIAANLDEVAQNNTMMTRHEETIADLQAAREVARIAHVVAEVQVYSAESAIRQALTTMNTSTVQAVKDAQRIIVVAQSSIVSQQEGIVTAQLGQMRNLDERIANMQSLIQEAKADNTALHAANRLIESKLVQARDYIGDLENFVSIKVAHFGQIANEFDSLSGVLDTLYDTLTDAQKVMNTLNAFHGVTTDLIPVDEEPDWDDWREHRYPSAPDDPAMPQLPPGLSDTTGTGATHTTTGTTGAPSDAQDEEDDEEGDEENDADGDSHMGIQLNVNLAPDPAAEPTTRPGNAQSHPPADALSTIPNPPGQSDVTGASHSLRLQVEMVHPSWHTASATDVLSFDAVAHKITMARAIIDAWLHTLPSSVGLELQGLDIVPTREAGSVTLLIQFSDRVEDAAGTNGGASAAALAVLKTAIQEAVAVWEREQENLAKDATPTLISSAPEHQLVGPSQNGDQGDGTDTHAVTAPAPLQSTPPAPAADVEATLHYGTADMFTANSVMLWFEFKPLSGASGLADFIQRGHDIPALQGVLAHWMGSIDPGFAATIVAFQMEDYDPTGDCDFMLQVLVNDMRVIPNQATLMALQNAMQDYLATPESPAWAPTANPDGTTHQALSVVGLAEHGGLG